MLVDVVKDVGGCEFKKAISGVDDVGWCFKFSHVNTPQDHARKQKKALTLHLCNFAYNFKGDCAAREKFLYVFTKVYPWMTVVLFFFLPMLVIIICNISIVRIVLITDARVR